MAGKRAWALLFGLLFLGGSGCCRICDRWCDRGHPTVAAVPGYAAQPCVPCAPVCCPTPSYSPPAGAAPTGFQRPPYCP